jgi:hypothetical protein
MPLKSFTLRFRSRQERHNADTRLEILGSRNTYQPSTPTKIIGRTLLSNPQNILLRTPSCRKYSPRLNVLQLAWKDIIY